MKNKFAVIAGDGRMLNLALSLADLSYEVNAVGFEKTEVCSLVRCKDCLFDAVCDVNAVVFPVPLTDDGISVRAPFSDGEIRISDVLQCVDAKKTVVFVPK
ncbi:MAG: dipicolinate synthase subunit A N-terminal domain-containing protein, partial [Acutalibacteraceae bacterium]